MARREGSALVWEMADERLKLAVREAFLLAPLPNPPLELPDFPAIPPSDAESLLGKRLEFSQLIVRDSIYV